jgi:hypothetical protein
MNDLEQFYNDLQEEVKIEAIAVEEGCSREEMFTRLMLGRLEESGEAENATTCRDVRESRTGQTLHKVNGYALSEGFETLDLYVTLYRDSSDIPRLNAQDLRSTVSQLARFVDRSIKGYVDEIEESAPVFDLALTLHRHYRALVRVNLFVLTNGIVVAQEGPPPPDLGNDILTRVEIRDLSYWHRLSTAAGSRIPLEINFLEEFGHGLSYVPFNGAGDEYSSYLAIIPGNTLAQIYQIHGARLLEQNVRAFLQFTGKVNRGIQRTIKEEPIMFFAYNNGIAATANSVEVRPGRDGQSIIAAVTDFQIVNGGQTTASIFHTLRKDRAELDQIAVPVKLTVIRQPDRFTEIVRNIARYANSQNKISEADLSAGSPFNIELERLSRSIWAPAVEGDTTQTHWFFERARAQYKTALNKDALTAARRKAFEKQNPRRQRFDKEDVARFIHSWDGKPWLVVRGRQKSHAEFTKSIKNLLPDRQYFEDLIARAIIFKEAEHLYGTKSQEHVIGDLRYIVVPYALSWLNHELARKNTRIDLWKIWKRQSVSAALSSVIRATLLQTERLVRTLAKDGLVGEWGKKEESWTQVVNYGLSVDIALIEKDFEDPARPRPVYDKMETETLQIQLEEERIMAFPGAVWSRISQWFTTAYPTPVGKPDLLQNVPTKVYQHRRLSDGERTHAIFVLERALNEARDLFADVDDINAEILRDQNERKRRAAALTPEDAIDVFKWERKNCRLGNSDITFLKGVRDGRYSLESSSNADRLLKIVDKAEMFGYERAVMRSDS